jgi:hypothetical protein
VRYAVLLSMLAAPFAADAQNVSKPARPIQDNSFLIEEAYNQEKRVVQHILTAERSKGLPTGMELTQEWPLGGLRHQLSYSIPFAFDDGFAIGDAMVNYRYQLRGDGDALVAVSPRISLILPTSKAGSTSGFEAFVPASIVLARQLVTHSNAGAAIVSLENVGGSGSEKMQTITLGQSLIWLAHPNLNLMFEALWQRDDFRGVSESRATLAPGVRGALNLASGMQIVPGIAAPFGVGPSKGEHSLFVYFSVEHSF